MKNLFLKLFSLVSFGVFVLTGCSASDVTEEYEAGQKEVTYKTEEKAPQSEVPTQTQKEQPQIQESNVVVTTQPEYIPQGPPNPPPPPIKVNLESETPPATEKTIETKPSDLYQYKVQVFAFKSRLNAETEAKKLRKRLPDQQVYVEFQDNLYKVRLGIYSKWEHAKGIKDALFNLGYTDSFIITEVKQ
ncbi:MAG: SPOR domain-containing protein [Ignavibacteria bacterium]